MAFELKGERSAVRCMAVPTHNASDRVAGTLCLAIEAADMDLRENAEPLAS